MIIAVHFVKISQDSSFGIQLTVDLPHAIGIVSLAAAFHFAPWLTASACFTRTIIIHSSSTALHVTTLLVQLLNVYLFVGWAEVRRSFSVFPHLPDSSLNE
ncbi:hypothetical protein T12_10658 [Trichinella patagoniensis]|uniref:Uncharacterized protein n=1 Tax=Trichinella patagoniensis TaxID=990121 RepID=A0A0V0ZGY0_9BILA|nr:hypothetical protein T12_10658 [Trichinella patagoniensis]